MSSDVVIKPGLLRVVLAFIVMLHHSFGFFGYGAIAVYLFFVLSGFWVSKLWVDKYCKLRFAVPVFIASRWLRIMPLLCASILIAWLAAWLRPDWADSSFFESAQTLRWWLRIFAGVGISDQVVALPVVWSLDVEMQFYLLFPAIALLLLGGRPSAWVSVSWIVALFILGLFFLLKGAIATEARLYVFMLFFMVGVIYSRGKWYFTNRAAWLGLSLFLLCIGIVYMMPKLRHLLMNYSAGRSSGDQVKQNLMMYVLAIPLIPLALNSVNGGSEKFDRWLGNLAYPLYLVHFLPIHWYHQIRFDGAYCKIAGVLVAWIVSFALAALLSFGVDKPFEYWRRCALKRVPKRANDSL